VPKLRGNSLTDTSDQLDRPGGDEPKGDNERENLKEEKQDQRMGEVVIGKKGAKVIKSGP